MTRIILKAFVSKSIEYVYQQVKWKKKLPQKYTPIYPKNEYIFSPKMGPL